MDVRKVAFVVTPRSGEDMERLAERYLELMCPANLVRAQPLDVVDMLNQLEYLPDGLSALFGVADLPPGTEGRMDPFLQTVFVDTEVYRAAIRGQPRARMTCTHEAGHIQHMPQLTGVLDHGGALLRRRMNVSAPVYMDPEWQASSFASAILMPRTTAPDVYRDGGLGAVVSVFGVSQRAAEVRVDKLRRSGAI